MKHTFTRWISRWRPVPAFAVLVIVYIIPVPVVYVLVITSLNFGSLELVTILAGKSALCSVYKGGAWFGANNWADYKSL